MVIISSHISRIHVHHNREIVRSFYGAFPHTHLVSDINFAQQGEVIFNIRIEAFELFHEVAVIVFRGKGELTIFFFGNQHETVVIVDAIKQESP